MGAKGLVKDVRRASDWQYCSLLRALLSKVEELLVVLQFVGWLILPACKCMHGTNIVLQLYMGVYFFLGLSSVSR